MPVLYKTIARLSVTLAVLVAAISLAGLVVPGFYAKETFNWQVQTYGQDLADLFMAIPTLLLGVFMLRKKPAMGISMWAGATLYLLYTFVIYCFNIHFNRLFVLYCFVLGLSFNGFLYFLYSQVKQPIIYTIANKKVSKTIAVFFIVTSVLFYILWLKGIVPSILNNTTPAELAETGLFTNPVHVIDLAVFLPGTFITGLLLLAKHPAGYWLAPVFLVFFILMDITIGLLAALMYASGVSTDFSVVIIMAAMALFSTGLAIWYLKNVNH